MTGDPPALNAEGTLTDGSIASAVLSEQPDFPEMRDAAVNLLVQASESTNPLLRANALEALLPVRDQAIEVARTLMGDSNRGVRFVAAMSVGKLKLVELAPLVEPLLHDESQSVQAAAIYALHQCGRPVNLSPLASMLHSEDPEVKANAALVLGELGNASAVPMLRRAAGRGLYTATPARRKIAEMQLAEAMARLGAKDELEVIRAALFAPPEEAELTALACQMCGRLRDGGALPNLVDLATRQGRRQQSAEVRMAAAMAASMIDPSRDAKALMDVPAAYVNNDRYELRAQAAITLGHMKAQDALPTLWRLMHDPNPLVQISAAGGVLRVLKD